MAKLTLAHVAKGDTFVLAADGRRYARTGSQPLITIRDIESGKLRHLSSGLEVKSRRAAK